MKFRFVGGLDCPDWILAEIAQFTSVPQAEFTALCKFVCQQLLRNERQVSAADCSSFGESSSRLEEARLKGAVAALSFIVEKAAKNRCSASDLEKEMLQLGMSAEHAPLLRSVYEQDYEQLVQVLSRAFWREPSLTLTRSSAEVIDGVPVHSLNCLSSDGKLFDLVVSDQKKAVLKEELQRALDALEPYCNTKRPA